LTVPPEFLLANSSAGVGSKTELGSASINHHTIREGQIMVAKPPPNIQNGLIGEAKGNNSIEITMVSNGTGVGSFTKTPRQLSGDVVTLLGTGIVSFTKSGKKSNPKVEKILVDNPVPATSCGLVPNRKAKHETVRFQFGDLVLLVELPHNVCTKIADALKKAVSESAK
jgi:hypothetical protein